MYWRLFLGIWLFAAPAWGQTPSASPGESSKSTAQQSSERTAINSAGADQSQRQIQPQRPHLSKGLQIPKRTQDITPILVFFSAALGALVFMSLFTFAQYLLNRDAPYGWYALYLLITATWLWQSILVWLNGTERPLEQTIFSAYMLLLKYGMIVSYILFIGHLLEVPLQQPRLYRWTRYFVWFYSVSVPVLLAGLLMPNAARWYLTYVNIGIDVLIYAGLLFLITRMLRTKHPLMRYVLIGFGLILSAAMAATFLKYTGLPSTDQLFRMPLFYVAVTTLLEILCFSLALGRRFQLNKEEKIQTQQQLIQQLEENGRLQQSHTLELQQQLAQRETEVLTKAHELEEQRISQLRSDFERRVAEAEMAGLRSQMNPHFIFNCLNSIKLYATENDSEKASEYLTKFSRLIRMVLENSRSERVTLQNELTMLQLYADMEIMRFKQKLSFFVEIEPSIDANFVEIPPLLIQPYVENAIWHGLMHKSEGGSVRIRATQPQEEMLQLTITDDGVGRARAAELRSKSASHRKSFGLKMTSERIALVNQLYQTRTQVAIEDIVSADGQPAGTEVILQIPI
jgi:sensor histidine kinase YesM